MKQHDVTRSVMKKVVLYEKRQSARRIVIYAVSFILVTIGIGLFLTQAVSEMSANKTLDLLTLFFQEREIIDQFWQDTLIVLWEELPKNSIAVALLGILATFFIVYIFRRKLKILYKKVHYLVKYK